MCNQLTENKLKAMAEAKCPRCRSGKMFVHSSYNLGKLRFTQMFTQCPVCKLEFEIEPGFFWGAMYVSYAVSVAMSIAVALSIYFLFNDPETWVYITSLITLVLAFSPLSYRYSRVLMIYLISPIKFDRSLANT